MKIIIVGLWVGLLGLTVQVFAKETETQARIPEKLEAKTVQKWIEQNHAHWRAKESWLVQLSKSELKKMMGVQKPPQGRLDFKPFRVRARALETSLDWRNKSGVNWLGPIMNQGSCGSCVAFAAVATLEARTSIAFGAPWLHPTYSAQNLFSCGGGACEWGWEVDFAADYLQRSGVPDEACMPYTSGSLGRDVSCSQACADAPERRVKITDYALPTSGGGSVDDVKSALKKGPLVTTLNVYSDFVTYSSGIYKHVGGELLGAHAVSVVGFDDTRRAWLIRNSWGPEWGEGGFGWMSWDDDDTGVGADTWSFEVNLPESQISVISPADREYVSGEVELVAQGKNLNNSAIKFTLKSAVGRNITEFSCQRNAEEKCSTLLDTSQLKEGRYEISIGSASDSSVRSQVREFYVINSEPKMSLSLEAAEGTDLTAPLSGRPEFVLKTTFSPVPIQRLEFRVIDQDGKIVLAKTNNYVLENMLMGWRTMTVPDGKYTILLHGETTYKGKIYSVESNAISVSTN